jgi:holin-like protein
MGGRIMLGLAILLVFNFLGVFLNRFFDIPLPGNVIGLILFTAALALKIVKLQWVEDAAQFMLRHMLVFFAPFVVGTMVFFSFIAEQWISIAISLIVSSVASLLVTGWATKWLLERRGERVQE